MGKKGRRNHSWREVAAPDDDPDLESARKCLRCGLFRIAVRIKGRKRPHTVYGVINASGEPIIVQDHLNPVPDCPREFDITS